MIPNIKPSQVYPVKDQIAPVSIAAAGNATTGWIDAKDGNWLHGTVSLGAGGGTAQVDVLQATSNAGAGSKALSTPVAAGATGTVDFDQDLHNNLDLANNFRFVQVKVTITGGTGTLSALIAKIGPKRFSA